MPLTNTNHSNFSDDLGVTTLTPHILANHNDQNRTLSRFEVEVEPPLLSDRDSTNASRRKFRSPLDINIYATKKTVAQGMLDIALLTANASQLKYVLREGYTHEYYLLNLSLLGTSIFLQLLVGMLLIVKGRYNLNIEDQQDKADSINNVTVVCIFLITVVNVVLSSFGIPGDPVKEVPKKEVSLFDTVLPN
ncbi:Uncharacterised protein g8101 [Pycnogonum litorale]